jgi:hypothetical protein
MKFNASSCVDKYGRVCLSKLHTADGTINVSSAHQFEKV